MAVQKTWKFELKDGPAPSATGRSPSVWQWSATSRDGLSTRSSATFPSLIECWTDAQHNGFEVPGDTMPWRGFNISTEQDGALVYSPF